MLQSISVFIQFTFISIYLTNLKTAVPIVTGSLAYAIFYWEILVNSGEQSPSKKLNSVALVRKGTIPTERPQLVGEISANFCG
jgi:hypothetical protein